MVAGELDFLDAGLCALVDLEHQVGARIRVRDDLGLDSRVEVAAAAIELDHAGDVLLDDRAPQRAAALGLDFSLELFLLELPVPFQGDPAERRVLDHSDDRLVAGAAHAAEAADAAGAADAHIGEQVGGVERLEGRIEVGGLEMLAVFGMEIGPDRIGFDPLVALDLDGGWRHGRCGGLRLRGGLRARRAQCRRSQGRTGEQERRDEAAHGQPICAQA